MSNINKYKQNEKATVCSGNNCVTVYGGTAKQINAIVVFMTTMILVAILIKAVK